MCGWMCEWDGEGNLGDANNRLKPVYQFPNTTLNGRPQTLEKARYGKTAH